MVEAILGCHVSIEDDPQVEYGVGDTVPQPREWSRGSCSGGALSLARSSRWRDPGPAINAVETEVRTLTL
jgi:hypothetical protein